MLGSIRKISTALDGGYTITFDVPENQKEEVLKLFDLTNQSVSVFVEIFNEESEEVCQEVVRESEQADLTSKP